MSVEANFKRKKKKALTKTILKEYETYNVGSQATM